MVRNPRNKFYVAADRMIDDPDNWRRESFNNAVEHAMQVLKQNPHKNEVIIVKVVAIVKREIEVSIEKVK